MRKYELTYLVSDSVPEKDLNKATGTVSGLISELGGKVDKEDIWGRRKLAYPIKKQDFATYVTLFFSLDASKCKEFERELHLNTSIIRQLLIVKELGSEKISLTSDEIAETKEIEEVIGGEKSFEAVEGMTEESRDLMAKRDDAEAEKEEAAVERETEEVKEETTEAVEEVKVEEATPETVETKEEIVEKPKTIKEKKPAAPKKKVEKVEDESERLSKLNDQLDDILKDEL